MILSCLDIFLIDQPKFSTFLLCILRCIKVIMNHTIFFPLLSPEHISFVCRILEHYKNFRSCYLSFSLIRHNKSVIKLCKSYSIHVSESSVIVMLLASMNVPPYLIGHKDFLVEIFLVVYFSQPIILNNLDTNYWFP